jgi:Rps23 Pro-64 3,4-dihydroxylase Tpa1-like proline 4-hydroxylase
VHPGALQAGGGQLALYNTQHSGPLRGCGYSAGEPATLVAPLAGRLLVFESRLEHEVLPSHGRR